MGHYNTNRTRDCTNDGNDHNWSNPKTKDWEFRVINQDGTTYIEIRWTEYQDCETEMEYHGGRGVGLTTGKVCGIEKDERKHVRIPMKIVAQFAETKNFI